MKTGKIHLIGICGSGMSSLALWYNHLGFQVTGCDRDPGENLRELEDRGIEVHAGHDPAHVEECDAVVFSAAVPFHSPELVLARERGIRVLRRSEALAELANGSRLVAVAGTHGKTTVTAMTGWILEKAGMDPTVMVGGRVTAWNGNFRPGGNLAVVEADEFDRTFLRLQPDSAAVTSFGIDHLECYGSPEALKMAFSVFLEMTRPGGSVVVPISDTQLARWARRIGRRVITAGQGGDVFCRELKRRGWEQDYVIDGISGTLPMPGAHNLRNAETAMALAETLGVSRETSVRALESFPGIFRRLEKIGMLGSSTVISDYAHHPQELDAVLEALLALSPGRVGVVFQPHLYSRTASHGKAMGGSLAAAAWSLVLPIYPAREEPVPGITSRLVVDGALKAGGESALAERENLAEELGRREADIIAFIGAGSVDAMARELTAGNGAE